MAPSQKFDYSYAHYDIIHVTLENVKLRKRFILLKFNNTNSFIANQDTLINYRQ